MTPLFCVFTGRTHAQTCGLHHGWQSAFCTQEKHGTARWPYAGFQQAGRGQPLVTWFRTRIVSAHVCIAHANFPSVVFWTRPYVGASTSTSQKWRCTPSASRTLNALKRRLMGSWSWPDRSLRSYWKNGEMKTKDFHCAVYDRVTFVHHVIHSFLKILLRSAVFLFKPRLWVRGNALNQFGLGNASKDNWTLFCFKHWIGFGWERVSLKPELTPEVGVW